MAALTAEKAQAEAENVLLKKMMKDYLEGISVGEDVLKDRRIVGGKMIPKKLFD